MPVVEWSFYADVYCGDMSEREFKRHSAAAEAFVVQITQGRELPEELGKSAICAVAEVMKRGICFDLSTMIEDASVYQKLEHIVKNTGVLVEEQQFYQGCTDG